MDDLQETPQPAASTPEHRPRSGPRRDEAARVAVLRAADDLLVDAGFQAMTVGAIAERAGVARQTIYRWWPSKVSILVDVLAEDLQDAASWPARTETAQTALEQHVSHLSAVFTRSATGRVLFVLIGHALQDAATAAALHGEVLNRQREYDRARLCRSLALSGDSPSRESRNAVTRHEVDELLDLMVGPAFYRAFTKGQPMDRSFVRRLTATALTSWRGSPSAAAPPASPAS